MAKKEAFRYNTGATKVPWAAVGENYNAEDLYEVVKFMMQGDGTAGKSLAGQGTAVKGNLRAADDCAVGIFAEDTAGVVNKGFTHRGDSP